MHILAILFICACSRNDFIFLAQICCYNEDIAPFQNYLTKEWKVSKLNEHTAQSPLLTEEPSGFFTQYSETHPSSVQGFIDVPLAYKEFTLEYYLTQTEDASLILLF